MKLNAIYSVIFFLLISINFITAQSKSNNFKKYTGEISKINSTYYVFGVDTLHLLNIENKIKSLFESGIIYPELLVEARMKVPLKFEHNNKNETKVKIESSNFSNTKLTITDFQLIEEKQAISQVKKFKFLVYNLWNDTKPSYYYIELTNQEASPNTEIEKFIKQSSLTDICRSSRL